MAARYLQNCPTSVKRIASGPTGCSTRSITPVWQTADFDAIAFVLTKTIIDNECECTDRRLAFSARPTRISCGLTNQGRSLAVPLMHLATWVLDHLSEVEAHRSLMTRKQMTHGSELGSHSAFSIKTNGPLTLTTEL